MKIENIFRKQIDRPINGVVKADQLDASSIWQELDEFVVTKELDKHIRVFFSAYLAAMEAQGSAEAGGNIGIWVSGFFGSGKSHLIKVISYLLENRTISHAGSERQAVSFFEDKIDDAMLFADIKKAVAGDTDVILFNIDSKADKRSDRAPVLTVFLRVLNEMLGYSGDHPHIAHMERHLDEKGKLAEFHENFRVETNLEWLKERDAYEFSRDEVINAFAKTLDQSHDSAAQWIDNADKNFSLTVENFCKWVKEYLDSRGPKHRLVFFVDEVGQFIGEDTGLMLNLQTITEQLGTTCGGRAWIVVTSQEDIDAVLGEVKASQANDFSKIQGRFKTRLSLSSANTDEVIQARLLEKTDAGKTDLDALFAKKGDIIKNQLAFTNVGMTFRGYNEPEDFSKNYPFCPYQFQLVQKIFESIRKAGATGLHLSRGERSMLDAFQSAATQVKDKSVGVLIPLYRFYPSIESFLDTSVKRTIDQATSNPSLDEFDVNLLRTLFLIRYVDEMKGNVDNLVTLCVDEVDSDRLALRTAIETSLQKLIKETLIGRGGDVYFFLTNEEQDISREINNIDLNSSDEARFFGGLIFGELLKGDNKHRYSLNKKDFSYTRLCDLHPIGNRVEKGLLLSVITPLIDDYELYDEAKCILKSTEEDGNVLIRLPKESSLDREMRTYLRTDKYIGRKNDGTQPESTRRIISDRRDENRDRRERLLDTLDEMFTKAEYYVAGQKLDIRASAPQSAIAEAFNNLITNTFSKMSYLQRPSEDPKRELQSILRVNDIGQQSLAVNEEDGNPKAILEVRNFIDLATRASRKIVLNELIERFEIRPFGWLDMETLIILGRLVVLGEISLLKGGDVIAAENIYDVVIKPSNWRGITVMQRRSAPTEAIQAARSLGQRLFSEVGPDGEDTLVVSLRDQITRWERALREYRTLADTGNYPGKSEIEEGLNITARLNKCKESVDFIEQFNEMKDELVEFSEAFHEVDHFYKHQKAVWESLRKARDGFQLNEVELSSNVDAASGLNRMSMILEAPSPYGLVHEANDLIGQVGAINESLVAEQRAAAIAVIDSHIEQITKDLDSCSADAPLRDKCITPLKSLRGSLDSQKSIAHISQALGRSESLLDIAIKALEEAQTIQAQASDSATGGDEVTAPAVKKSRTVEPAKLTSKTYLETHDDVSDFVDKLRKELDDAIDNDERIRIR